MTQREPLLTQAINAHRAGQLEEARTLYRAMLDRDPRDARAWFGLGSVNAQCGASFDAIIEIERAMAISGPHAEHHHNMANAKAAVGRFAEARTHYQEAVRLKPDYAEAYFNMSGIGKFERSEGVHERIEALLGRPEMSLEDRRFLHFAAGNVYDAIGEYGRAFAHYERGNALKGVHFDREATARLEQESATVFSSEFLKNHASAGNVDDRFVFIVGMPRSGTTLVEQVVASHSRVFGAGELSDIAAIAGTLPRYAEGKAHYPKCMRGLDSKALGGFGKTYADRVGAMHPEMDRYIDKNPNNFRFLGLINSLLPSARVIHCRNPLDTCLSCFFQNFRNGQEFSFQIGDLAVYYAHYQRLMKHWRRIMTLPMIEIDYERLVMDPEPNIRRLIKFLDLPWEAACLRHQDTARGIHTASRWQARQGIYTGSVARRERYAEHLGPLREALSNEGIRMTEA